MSQNSLFPNFIRFSYTSAFGAPHSQTIPTNNIEPSVVAGVTGFLIRGIGADTIQLGSFADQFAQLGKMLLAPSSAYTEYTAYSMATASSQPIPIFSGSLNAAGTQSSSAVIWSKAVQRTMTFRTDLFGKFQLVFLDAPTGGFDRVSAAGISGDVNLNALAVFVRNGFIRGRDGGIPTTPLQMSNTLNEKLRRSYGML